MDHIASRDALDASTGHLLQQAASLDEATLSATGEQLGAVAQLLVDSGPLRRVLSEATTAADQRAALVHGLLADKVNATTASVVDFTVRQAWANGHDLAEGLRRLARTALFLRAERAGELDEVEDQLFRFERIFAASPDLSVLLDDPAADPVGREQVVSALVAGKANPLTVDLLTQLARDPGGRSFSHGLTELVEQAAARQHKRVAVVQAAVALTDEQRDRLTVALGRIYHGEISLHVVVDPDLLGGLRITVGDEVIDGSTVGRLATLRTELAG